MATADQLKALLKSYAARDDDRFRSVAMQIAAHSASKGNVRLAEELRSLVDESRRRQAPAGEPRAVPIVRPVGELAGLITAAYPNTRLSDMVLSEEVQSRVEQVIRQYRRRDLLRSHGLAPRRKLLLIGPPGCGKTMTASVLASECGLPLMFVQLHGLITRYMGETAAKLHLVFEAMEQTLGVYLFDEFDALGASRDARNDVGEIRRVLNSFLQFIERDESNSIIVAATNYVDMLDEALFRRFDDVILYKLPNASMVQALVENRLSTFNLEGFRWRQIVNAARGLSHAEIVRACEDSARETVLAGEERIGSERLESALRSRRNMRLTTSRSKRKIDE